MTLGGLAAAVGKTELCKAIASGIFPPEERDQAFIRLDMSGTLRPAQGLRQGSVLTANVSPPSPPTPTPHRTEYQDKASVSKFLGAAPGYVGFSDGAPLVNALERRQGKGAIVLLDELEKADPDILTVLLQLFDEGRITSAKGRTINCTTAIFVCTSNVGSAEISKLAPLLRPNVNQPSASAASTVAASTTAPLTGEGEVAASVWTPASLLDAEETLVRAVEPALKAAFKRDEFLGRISEIIPFLPLLPAELELIVHQILQVRPPSLPWPGYPPRPV